MWEIDLGRQRRLLGVLEETGALYVCPKDAGGRRLGPLVGCAARYRQEDGTERQQVSEQYVNFAMVEQLPSAVEIFAAELAARLPYELARQHLDWVMGLPEGGKTLAFLVTYLIRSVREIRYLYPEKQVTALAAARSRARSRLVFGRHAPQPGSRGIVVDDVFNNFSTAGEALRLIQEAGAETVALVSVLNRSVWQRFEAPDVTVPVLSLLHLPMPSYRQDDPYVRDDVAAGNVVWQPKDHYAELAALMAEHGISAPLL